MKKTQILIDIVVTPFRSSIHFRCFSFGLSRVIHMAVPYEDADKL